MSGRSTLVGAFLLGMLAGSAGMWSFAHSRERFRRIRRDLKAGRNGLRTLRTMLRREAATLAKAALGVAVLVGVLVALLAR